MNARSIAVCGIGTVTAAGTGCTALAQALADPDWRPVVGLDRPDGPPLPVATCAGFKPLDHLPPLAARRLDRPARLLAVAAREALADAGGATAWSADRVGVTAGTWNAGTTALVDVLRTVFLASPDEAPPMQFPSTVANAPASQFGILDALGGPNLTFCEKQAGGLRAIEQGARLIATGRADAVITGGVDEAHWLNAEGYDRLGALRRPGRPGMVLAEGAATLLLTADGRHAPIAHLAGAAAWSLPAPAWSYPNAPDGIVRACRLACERAGVGPSGVDLVVAMSNGLPLLDALEASALETLFSPRRPSLVAPATRFGEGAFAGALRAAVAVLLLGGRATATWPPPDHLAARGFRAPSGHERTALVTALAAGGSSVALVFTRP